MAQVSEEAAIPKNPVDMKVLTVIASWELNVSAQHHAHPFKKCINAWTAQQVTFIPPATAPTSVTLSGSYFHHSFIWCILKGACCGGLTLAPCPRPAHPPPQQDGGETKIKKFTGWDKDRPLTYQPPSQVKYTHLVEN